MKPPRDIAPSGYARDHAEADRDGLAFALMPGIGCVSFREAVERKGSAAAAFRDVPEGLARSQALACAGEWIARAGRCGARILMLGETAYPEPLLDLPEPPAFLFAIGDAGLAAGKRVGIVGTRQASSAGERIAHRIAAECARAGAVVVSGMALGIDAAAHRGALDTTGATIAVLGGGADMPYPPTHASLHRRITSSGLVLSEAPPGSHPIKGAFPRRNRIIAALSDILVVVEAGHRSGALITASQALDLGRPVAAVPGPIDSPRNVGTNRLLAAGAQFIATPDDVLQLAGLTTTRPNTATAAGQGAAESSADAGACGTSANERAVMLAVSRGASDPDAIARGTGIDPRELGAALVSLELTGALRVDATGAIVIAG
jgi:DNA processing protein